MPYRNLKYNNISYYLSKLSQRVTSLKATFSTFSNLKL